MVDHAEYIIGVFDNQKKLRSGTAQTAVSYTHLDVYKRQIKTCFYTQKCEMWQAYPHRTRRNPPICLPSAAIWMRSPETVA